MKWWRRSQQPREPDRGVWMSLDEAGVRIVLRVNEGFDIYADRVPARTILEVVGDPRNPENMRARFLPIP